MKVKLAAGLCLLLFALTACASSSGEVADETRTVTAAASPECKTKLDSCKVGCKKETDLASQNACNSGCLKRFKTCS